MNSFFEIVESKKNITSPIIFELIEDEVFEYSFSDLYERVICLIEIFTNANFNGKKVLVRVQNNFESIALIIALLKINVDINLTNDEKKVDTKEYDAVLNSDIEHLESYNYFSQYSPNYKFNEKTLNLKSRVALFTSGSTGSPKPIYFNEEDIINKYLIEENNDGKYFTPTNISCMSGFLRNFIEPILLNKQTYLRTGLFNLDNKQDELNYIEEFYKNVCNYNISNIFITKNMIELIPERISKNYNFDFLKEVFLTGEIYSNRDIEILKQKLPGLSKSAIKYVYGSTEACGAVALSEGKEIVPIYVHEAALLDNVLIFTYDKQKYYTYFNGEIIKLEQKFDDDYFVDFLPVKTNNKKIKTNSLTCKDGYNSTLNDILIYYDNKWNNTGDIGFEVNDNLYIIGRKDDVIISNNEKYITAIIEKRLQQFTSCPLAVFERDGKLCVAICVDEDFSNPYNYRMLCDEINKIIKDRYYYLDFYIMNSKQFPKVKGSNKILRKNLNRIIDNHLEKPELKTVSSPFKFLFEQDNIAEYFNPIILSNGLIEKEDIEIIDKSNIYVKKVKNPTEYLNYILKYKYISDAYPYKDGIKIELNDNILFHQKEQINEQINFYCECDNYESKRNYRDSNCSGYPIGLAYKFKQIVNDDCIELHFDEVVYIYLENYETKYGHLEQGCNLNTQIFHFKNIIKPISTNNDEMLIFPFYYSNDGKLPISILKNVESKKIEKLIKRDFDNRKIYRNLENLTFEKPKVKKIKFEKISKISDESRNILTTKYKHLNTPINNLIDFINDETKKSAYAILGESIGSFDYVDIVAKSSHLNVAEFSVANLYFTFSDIASYEKEFEKILFALSNNNKNNTVVCITIKNYDLLNYEFGQMTLFQKNEIISRMKLIENVTNKLMSFSEKKIIRNGEIHKINTSNLKIILCYKFINPCEIYKPDFEFNSNGITNELKDIYNTQIFLNKDELNFDEEVVKCYQNIYNKVQDLKKKLEAKNISLYINDFSILWNEIIDSSNITVVEEKYNDYISAIETLLSSSTLNIESINIIFSNTSKTFFTSSSGKVFSLEKMLENAGGYTTKSYNSINNYKQSKEEEDNSCLSVKKNGKRYKDGYVDEIIETFKKIGVILILEDEFIEYLYKERFKNYMKNLPNDLIHNSIIDKILFYLKINIGYYESVFISKNFFNPNFCEKEIIFKKHDGTKISMKDAESKNYMYDYTIIDYLEELKSSNFINGDEFKKYCAAINEMNFLNLEKSKIIIEKFKIKKNSIEDRGSLIENSDSKNFKR